MNRRSVIRSILGLSIAPKILGEIDFKPLTPTLGPSASLFQELHLLVPDYLPKLIEKYGSRSWGGLNSSFWNENNNSSLNV